jgi:sulfate adenylyltransferase large subunit
MDARATDFAFDEFLRAQEQKSLLRFIACGSVDHGKSTLIGRLLYEAKSLFEDQVAALETESRKYGTLDGELDYSLLLDGLSAEREQKITIDVAYRFFTTDRRKFIVIDSPGHEQYTPNMATGASMADVALILVDARAGITRQTKRHSLIVSTLGVRHIVLAVNKMDLVDWSEGAFREIEGAFRDVAEDLGITEVVCIPVAARSGDNVVTRSTEMDWYDGPTLLDYLENVEVVHEGDLGPFRMPIQWVNRPTPDFRGLSGLITRGEVHTGMPVRILPSGQVSRIARIATFDGDLKRAAAGRSVTLTLTDEVDASRGDIIAEMEAVPEITDRLAARVFWMDRSALAPGRSYLIKLAAATATAKVSPGLQVIDLDTRKAIAADLLAQNEIGVCAFELDRKVAVDHYADARETGSFILIDPESYDTVGMGCIEDPPTHPTLMARWLPNWVPFRENAESALDLWTATHARSLAKAVIWRVAASAITILLVYVITRSLQVAISVAAAEIVIKTLTYYFHERMWMVVPWGKRGDSISRLGEGRTP